MPETPQPPDEGDRPAPSPAGGGADHETLDVAEWVSELRRLYVEPKTRAEVHQESAIAPLRRKLRLRGPRRAPLPVDVEAGPADESTPEPVQPAAPDSVELPPLADEPVTWDLKADPAPVPAPVAPAVDYAPPPPRPAVSLPDVDDASEPLDHQPAAAWLFSYLEATGHGTDAEVSRASPPSPATATDVPGLDETPPMEAAGDPPDTLVSEALPGDVEAPVDDEQLEAVFQVETETEEEPKPPQRSLADLAGVSAAATAAYSVASTASPVDADAAAEAWSTTELGDGSRESVVDAATVEAVVDVDAPDTVNDRAEAEVEVAPERGLEEGAAQGWFAPAPEGEPEVVAGWPEPGPPSESEGEQDQGWAEPDDTDGAEPAEDPAESELVSEPQPERSWDLCEQSTDEMDAEPTADVGWSERDAVQDEELTDSQPEPEVEPEPEAVPERDWAEPEARDEVEPEPSADVELDDLAASGAVTEPADDVAEPEAASVLERDLEGESATDLAGVVEVEQVQAGAEPESTDQVESEPSADVELDDLAASGALREPADDVAEPEPASVLEPDLEDEATTDLAGGLESEQAPGWAEPEQADGVSPAEEDDLAEAALEPAADREPEPEPERADDLGSRDCGPVPTEAPDPDEAAAESVMPRWLESAEALPEPEDRVESEVVVALAAAQSVLALERAQDLTRPEATVEVDSGSVEDLAEPVLETAVEPEPVQVTEEAAPDSHGPESVVEDGQAAEPGLVESETKPVLDDLGEPEPDLDEVGEAADSVQQGREPAFLPETEPEPEPALVAGPEAAVDEVQGMELDEEREAEPDSPEPEPEPEPEPSLVAEPDAALVPEVESEPERSLVSEPAAAPVTDVEPEPEVALVPEPDAVPEPEPDRELVLEASPEHELAPSAQPGREAPLEPAAEFAQDGEPEAGTEPRTTRPTRPSESAGPHIAVSWRGADYFEGEPDLDESAELIIVEPPSQMYAAGRRRRPEPRVRSDEDPDATPARTDPTTTLKLDGSATADHAPADPPAGKSRRALVLALLLVVVLAAVWYFLLRDPGSGSAAPAGGTGSAVVALAPETFADRLTLSD